MSSINFSSGGFESRFGDKMSSVLDIRYNKPIEFSGAVSLSLLGGTAHMEDVSKNGKFTYDLWTRKSTQGKSSKRKRDGTSRNSFKYRTPWTKSKTN